MYVFPKAKEIFLKYNIPIDTDLTVDQLAIPNLEEFKSELSAKIDGDTCSGDGSGKGGG